MKWGTRVIATMAGAVFLVPALFADDMSKPADATKKDEFVISGAATPEPSGKIILPLPMLFPRQGPARGGSGKNSAKHSRASRGQGETTPKVELFVGYSYWRAVPGTTSNRIDAMNGASASVAYNFNRRLGLVVDIGGFKVDSLLFSNPGPGFTPTRVVDADSNVLTFLIGPRVSFRSQRRLTPFLQILGGAAQADLVTVDGCAAPIYACTPLPRETAFAMTAGGGLDLRLNHRIALRLVQAEFLLTRFENPTSANGDAGWQTNLRLSTGIVFRFGGNPPPPPPPPVNHSPLVSCSIDPRMVYAGSGDMASAHAVASDPDNDSLTYSWAASGGAMDSAGADAKWNSSGTAAGTYAVRVRVEDGRGGTADCSAEIRVDPRPNHPPTISCSANPSSVFSGEVSRITCAATDPDGDPLNYTWQANSGRITGNGPAGNFDTTGLSPGTYAITTRVDDGRGGAAEGSTPVQVKAVSPPPLASKINECMFDKPLSVRIDNVCKRILDDVALRLQNEPRATAVIIGYSDPGERKPAQVAGDRATNAVKYLGEKGIDPSRATTRSGSAKAGPDSENRRIEVIWVPEGATY